MSHRAHPRFISELKKYGRVNIESCFNCGNCSAVCPLSSEGDSFPRRMIRYAQIGMKERLEGSNELWLCYYCGECTATCPRQAEPGEFMAAARRYAIGKYDPLGIARPLYTSAAFNVLFLAMLAAVIGLLLYSFRGSMPGDMLRLFEFIPVPVIHNLGVIAGMLIIVATLAGVGNMIFRISREARFPPESLHNPFGAIKKSLVELFAQERYRRDCEAYAEARPWYIRKWFIHASILWGFMGLFLATVLDYLLDLLGFKATGTWVPVWHPIRLLGTLAGILFIYGVTVAIVKRFCKADEPSTHSTPSDWSFLILLWLGGMTGFALEFAIYLPQSGVWGYWMLLIHLVVVLELLILWPFTKSAHAVYRIVALCMQAVVPVSEAETERLAAEH